MSHPAKPKMPQISSPPGPGLVAISRSRSTMRGGRKRARRSPSPLLPNADVAALGDAAKPRAAPLAGRAAKDDDACPNDLLLRLLLVLNWFEKLERGAVLNAEIWLEALKEGRLSAERSPLASAGDDVAASTTAAAVNLAVVIIFMENLQCLCPCFNAPLYLF